MPGNALPSDDFRQAMSRFASGVTVVTTRDGVGKPWGFTASAFSSLSLEPPLVLVCLDRRADCFRAFEAAGAFAVSILREDQAELALRFAAKGVDKFGPTALVGGSRTELPLVDGAIAWLECRVHTRLDGGDHVILIGEVLSASVSPGGPLLHYNRSFGRFGPGG